MNCINCGLKSEANYCPKCGQRLKVKRITFREGFQDFSGRIYGFDSQFPRTFRDVTIRPGITAAKYIEGNRVLYYGPVGYYFLMITLMFIVASMLGIDIAEVMSQRSRDLALEQPPAGSGLAEAQRMIQSKVMDNFRIFSFTLVVFLTVWLKVFFRKSSLNLLEHSVMVFFVMGHMYWLTIADLIIEHTTGFKISYILSLSVMVLFFGFAVTQVYNYQSKVKAFLKGILSFFVAYLTFVLVITAFTIIIFMTDPEMRELLRKP